MIVPSDITGVVLAGGAGSRMGGMDKGLQTCSGMPMALHALLRLQPQVGQSMISANRNLTTYRTFGVPVVPDALHGHAGPLAGFLAALENCRTAWLATVPCDTPWFPADLVRRLADAADDEHTDLALAVAREASGGPLRVQPVFCLLRVSLKESLRAFLDSGGRKAVAWARAQRMSEVRFDRPADDARAFVNANTLDELRQLEQVK